jgi:hypothetical protein
MSIVALKRKYQTISGNSGINQSRNTPSSSGALRNLINTRGNSKNFYILPDTNASENIQKNKGFELYAEKNCVINNSPSIPAPECKNKKVCNVFKDLTTPSSSSYIESKKGKCNAFDDKIKIKNVC